MSESSSKLHGLLKSASYILPLSLRKRFMDPVYGRFVFSKFKDAKFDRLGWKYVLPEPVAVNFAKNFKGLNILDAYAGIGGTSIQLALAGNSVTSSEIDPKRFKLLEHNASLYQANGLRAINCDVKAYLQEHPTTFDVICVDPPWKDIKTDFKPYVDYFKKIAPVLVFSVSKNVPNEMIFAAGANEVREVYVNNSMFHKEAFFYQGKAGQAEVLKQTIILPEMEYMFP